MDEETTPVAMVATCQTAGCPVDGVPFNATLYANAAPPIYRAVCGQCGQIVTDLVPVP
ncbi:hypothetical protein [Actinacidiphila oryziradicis]|uniref:hypothetical protein n=1 Tax=Actinacidiphila oryziradicis TaxID=2571141 RepID=UPI00145FAAE1|nr:hypothetical protein [Actinacidiphila oryziradicis]